MKLFESLITAIGGSHSAIPEMLPELVNAQKIANPDLNHLLSSRQLMVPWNDVEVQVCSLPVAAWRAGKAGAIYTGIPIAAFRSSGTTSADRSETLLDVEGLALYEAALKSGFSQTFGHAGEHIIALMPDASSAPESSLSAMCQLLGAEFVFGDGWQQRLQHRIRKNIGPIVLFGTAYAWVHFLDATSGIIQLPEGSRLIETGGYKGKSRELTKSDLYTALAVRFDITTDAIWSEYGMCELSSQFYSQGLGTRLIPSPSIRSVAINPFSSEVCRPCEDGLLVHLDAANWCQYAVIETQDWGNVDANGHVELRGRAIGAQPKGCSIDADSA